MSKATIFKNFTVTVEDKPLTEIIGEIIEGKYRKEIEQLRQLIAAGKKEEAEQFKKKLPAFTPSGTFKGGRRKELLVEYSGFVILDIDHLQPLEKKDVFEKAANCPHTFFCCRSAGGNGLKILVEVDTAGLEDPSTSLRVTPSSLRVTQFHEAAYTQVADYYEKLFNSAGCPPREIGASSSSGHPAGTPGVTIDRSGKDVTRLCFYSYDPMAFKNINNEKFPVEVPLHTAAPKSMVPVFESEQDTSRLTLNPSYPHPALSKGEGGSNAERDLPPAPINVTQTNFGNLFERVVEFTNGKITFNEGNRNNYVFRLACNCNKAGIPLADALPLTLAQFNYDEREVNSTVTSAYKNHPQEFGQYARWYSNPDAGIAGSAAQDPAKTGFYKNSTGTVPAYPPNTFSTTLHLETLENMIHKYETTPPIPLIWSGIKEGTLGFIFGPPKSGKTIFCENLALSLAAGLPDFFGYEILPGHYPVLFISLEEFWQQRLERNTLQVKAIKEKVPSDFIHNLKTVNEDFPRLMATTADWEMLKAHIKGAVQKTNSHFTIC